MRENKILLEQSEFILFRVFTAFLRLEMNTVLNFWFVLIQVKMNKGKYKGDISIALLISI
jgi:hypothetical protein